MKKLSIILLLSLLLTGCTFQPHASIAATTLPVYEFSTRLCQGTPLTVTRLVTEQVSCLHDYSLKVQQVKAIQAAEVVVISGAGLEDFLGDVLPEEKTLDASQNITLLESHEHCHAQDHDGHHHDHDPHIWLSPENAAQMARNIAAGFSQRYPEYAPQFQENLDTLLGDLDVLAAYGEEQLGQLHSRELITFHDGFGYFAQAFQLDILEAVEEEAGSETSAKDLIHLIGMVKQHHVPAIFTERSGSTASAGILSRETGCGCYDLDMAMAGDSYFTAMYHNIDTIKEALG